MGGSCQLAYLSGGKCSHHRQSLCHIDTGKKGCQDHRCILHHGHSCLPGCKVSLKHKETNYSGWGGGGEALGAEKVKDRKTMYWKRYIYNTSSSLKENLL